MNFKLRFFRILKKILSFFTSSFLENLIFQKSQLFADTVNIEILTRNILPKSPNNLKTLSLLAYNLTESYVTFDTTQEERSYSN